MKTIYSNICDILDYKPIYKTKEGKYAVVVEKVFVEDKLQSSKTKLQKDKKPAGIYSFNYMIFDGKPTTAEIKVAYEDYINSLVENRIVNDFVYEGNHVNLSKENQINYKSAYDLAMQTNGANLPYKIRCKLNGKPQYLVFENTIDFTKFYVAMSKHIQNCLEDGWNKKDTMDYSIYVQ